MKDRVTQADIARAAGVTVASVSMALRDDPQISKELRERVAKLAKELGYRPDPMMSLLCTYRNGRRVKGYEATLGWIDAWKKPGELLAAGQVYRNYYEGALSRAEELGYRLETFRIHEPGMDEDRLSNILWSRGVAGLLIPPQQVLGGSLKLKWERFSAVTFGYSLGWPGLHRVSNSQTTSSLLATLHLWLLGYRRIGYCSNPLKDKRLGLVGMGFLGGYFAGLDRLPGLAFISPFRCPRETNLSAIKESLRVWFKENSLDAVIGDADCLQWLRELGLNPPSDFGYAHLAVDSGNPAIAGIDQRAFTTGEVAVDFLVGLIRKHERGIPKCPVRVLVDGVWFPGASVRKLRKKKSELEPGELEQILAGIRLVPNEVTR